MAVNIITNDDLNKNKPQSGGAVNPPPAAGSGLSQPTQGAATGTSSQTQNAKTTNQTGSGFTNVQNVVKANQQNQLGSTIGSGIQNQAGQVKTGLNQANQQFQQESADQSLGSDQNLQARQDVLNRIAQNQDASQPAVNQRDVDFFAKLRSGQYSGPQQLNNVDQLREQANAAQSLGQATGSAAGQQALLQRFVGKGPYTSGQRNLDATILGQTGTGALKQAAQGTYGLGTNVDAANTAAGERFKTEQGIAQQTAADTLNQIQNTQNPILSGIDTRVSQAQQAEQQRQQQSNAILDMLNQKGATGTSGKPGTQGLTDNQIVTNALTQAGQQGFISPDDIKRISALIPQAKEAGYNPKDLLKDLFQHQASENINQAGLATDTERAQLGALSSLAGTDNQFANRPGANIYKSGFDVDRMNSVIQDALSRKNNLGAVPNIPAPSSDNEMSKTNKFLLYGGAPVTAPTIAAAYGTKNAIDQYAPKVNDLSNNINEGHEDQAAGNVAGLVLNHPKDLADIGYNTARDTANVFGKGVLPDTMEQAGQQVVNKGVNTGADLAYEPARAPFQVQNSGLNQFRSLASNNLGSGGKALAGAAGLANTPSTVVNRQLEAQQNALKSLGSGQVDVNQLNEALNPLQAASKLQDDIASGIRDVYGNVTNLGTEVIGGIKDVGGQLTDKGKSLLGNLGGKIICTELNRQGILSDDIMALDRQFGKMIIKTDPEAMKGYLIIAKPIVRMMQKSKPFTIAISKVSIPWANHMAHLMDSTLPDNKLGKTIMFIGKPICKLTYKINKLYKNCLRNLSFKVVR